MNKQQILEMVNTMFGEDDDDYSPVDLIGDLQYAMYEKAKKEHMEDDLAEMDANAEFAWLK